MSTEARKARRRDRFRDGLSVKQYARKLRQYEIDSLQRGDGGFGMTLNLQTAARNDGTGQWRRVLRKVAA